MQGDRTLLFIHYWVWGYRTFFFYYCFFLFFHSALCDFFFRLSFSVWGGHSQRWCKRSWDGCKCVCYPLWGLWCLAKGSPSKQVSLKCWHQSNILFQKILCLNFLLYFVLAFRLIYWLIVSACHYIKMLNFSFFSPLFNLQHSKEVLYFDPATLWLSLHWLVLLLKHCIWDYSCKKTTFKGWNISKAQCVQF